MEDKPINKPLVIISFIVITFGAGWDVASGPVEFDEPIASIIAVICLLVSPLFVLWFKALWNEIIPRVTTWRRLTFLEAAGLMIISWFFT